MSHDSDDQMVDCSEKQSSATSAKEDNDNDTPPVAAPTSPDIRSTSRETTSEGRDFNHHHSGGILTRDKIEERAWLKAKLKFLDGNHVCIPPPPTVVDISGLYILITEVDNDWMPKDLIEDPQACIQFLHRMVEERTLGVKLGSPFGTWYLYGNSVCDIYVCQVFVLHRTLHISYMSPVVYYVIHE